jgi:hypothetical protein
MPGRCRRLCSGSSAVTWNAASWRMTFPGASGHCDTLARPPFALNRLRELDPEHLSSESTPLGRSGTGPLGLTPTQLLDRLAALIPPHRAYRDRHFGVLARTAA